MIKQLNVFIENKPGRLSGVTKALAEAKINIHALCIADTTDFGILRLIVSKPDTAKDILKKAGFMVKTTDVTAVAVEHKPGSLSEVLAELERADVSVEYMYAFTSRSAKYDAIVVFCLPDREQSAEKIKNCNINFVTADAIEGLDG